MKLPALGLVALLGACGGSGAAGDMLEPSFIAPDGGTWWHPGGHATMFWQLQGSADPTRNVGVYDLDGFNTTTDQIAALHARGQKVIAYIDAGSYEPDRPDSHGFPKALLGKGLDGWPGEYWLDVRPSGPEYATLQALMTARFSLCADKGFDAIEADNIDSYLNSPGFPTTADDQLAFDEWLATTVHGLGMAVVQKNDLDQIPTLEPYFDAALDEQCNQYGECATLAPYIAAGKPVWNAEYTESGETTAKFCADDVAAGIAGALYDLSLDGTTFSPCDNDVGNFD